MRAIDSVSIRVNEAVCDGSHIAFFERCFLDKYPEIVEECGGVAVFVQDVVETVVPSILMGANDQTNMELYISEQLCGSVSFAKRGEKAYVWGLYVAPDFQRTQIGTQLMEMVCLAVGEATVLSVQVMLESSEAQRFY